MARIMTLLAIFFLLINVWSGVLVSSGIAADMGMSPPTAGDEQVDTAESSAKDISTGTESKDTLFGLYQQVTNAIGSVFSTLTAGAAILGQIGVPDVFTRAIEIFIFVIYGLGLAQFVRGFDL
jgi:hypothetical protein